MFKNYKWAKIYKGKNGDPAEKWFVYYSFLNPSTAKFERIKVYEDINFLKDADQKNAYANELVDEINKSLKAGYNPFSAEEITEKKIHEVKARILLEENPKSPTLLDAFKEFLANKGEKNLSGDTMNAYRSYVGKFENYMFECKLADIRLDNLDTKFIKDMLTWLQELHKWNGTTYNNHLNFWVTLLNWFAKNPRKWVTRDSFYIGNDEQLEQKVTKPMKNQYFGDTVAEKVKQKMEKYPKLLFFSKFIYFSCMRRDEIRH